MFTEEEKLKYIYKIAHKVSRGYPEFFLDTVHEGYLGLREAETKWSDTPGGMPALACASLWIEGYMRNFFKRHRKDPISSKSMVDRPDDAAIETQQMIDLYARLEVALACLPPQDRALITNHYLPVRGSGRKSLRYWAKELRVKPTTVPKKREQILERLRSLMDEHSPCEIHTTT